MNTKQLRYGLLILLLLITGIVYSPSEAGLERLFRVASGDQPEPDKEGDKPRRGWPGEIPPKIKEGFEKPLARAYLAKKWEIRSYLALLAMRGNLNIVATPAVKGEMAIFLKVFEEVTVGEMLEIVLVTNKLAMEIKGDIIRIMTEPEFLVLYGRPYNETKTFKIIKLEHIQPSRMSKNFLNLIKSTGGTILFDDASMHLAIIEFPEKLRQMETIIKKTDIPLDTKIFEPKYAKVASIASLLDRTGALTLEVGKKKVDTRTNRIIITDTLENLQRISELITAIDAKPRQVLIEARMINIELDDTYYMGVNWQKVFSKVDIAANYPFPGNIQPPPGEDERFRATIGTMADDNYTAVLDALQMYGNTKLIASPRLSILNNQEAKFIVGRDEVIVTTTTTTGEGGVTTMTDKVETKEVGVSLAVSPTINADAFITMHLKPEVSSVVDYRRTATGNVLPIIEKTNVETDIIVKDGVTIVIGGLIRDEKIDYRRGIPFIQNLPFIGQIFQKTGVVHRKRETVIFLTPYIVSGEADSSVISKQEQMIRKKPKDIREIK